MINFILFLIASIGLLLTGWVGVLFGINRKGYFLILAISIDQTANAMLSPFFDVVMLKDSFSHDIQLFGNIDQTISYVLAVNKYDVNLTWFGSFWALFLEKLDKGHLNDAIESENTHHEPTVYQRNEPYSIKNHHKTYYGTRKK